MQRAQRTRCLVKCVITMPFQKSFAWACPHISIHQRENKLYVSQAYVNKTQICVIIHMYVQNVKNSKKKKKLQFLFVSIL